MIVLILLLVILALLLFAGGPDIIEWFLNVSDQWIDALRHIKNRRNRHD